MTAPFTSLLTEVAASEDGDTLIAAMQYALMIHYSYISSANEAVSKIVYGFLSASDGTYIGFAGTDEDTTNMAYLAMYSLFYSGQPILYSTDISLDDGLDVISHRDRQIQAHRLPITAAVQLCAGCRLQVPSITVLITVAE